MRIVTTLLLISLFLFTGSSLGSTSDTPPPKIPNSTYTALGISLLAIPFGKCAFTARGFRKIPYLTFMGTAGIFFFQNVKSNDDYKNTSQKLITEKWANIDEAKKQIAAFELAAEQEFTAEESAKKRQKMLLF